MIPKIIHYCWFGQTDMPAFALKCIDSWKQYLPDYKLMLWNENNFDVNCSNYTKQAYEARKYAFVSDYVRLFALYNYGGIYLDTDVEVLKPLDEFLETCAFSGFEDETRISTAIIGSEKHGRWIKENIAYYTNKNFIKDNGHMDLSANVITITNNLLSYGLILNNTYQNFEDLITIYPKKYFSPKSYVSKKIELTPDTYTIHHFADSWSTPYRKFVKILSRYLGKSAMKKLYFLKQLVKKI